MFLKGEIGRDKYVDPTTGRVTSYIYRSKPKWIIGSDIIQAQQAKLEFLTIFKFKLEVTLLLATLLALLFALTLDTELTAELTLLIDPVVNNPELIATAQKIAGGLKVNERTNVVLRSISNFYNRCLSRFIWTSCKCIICSTTYF